MPGSSHHRVPKPVAGDLDWLGAPVQQLVSADQAAEVWRGEIDQRRLPEQGTAETEL
jgi:hypothetical protein